MSKTINLPSTATVDDIISIYRLAASFGVKGVTIYRDKSKSSQVLTKTSTYSRERTATVYERRSGCGTIYIIPSTMPGNGDPWDTFAITSGGCAANSAAIGRLISGWLQNGGQPSHIARILSKVECPKCSRRDQHDGKSCADIIGRVILSNWTDDAPDTRPRCPECNTPLNFSSGCGQGECPGCGWSGCN